MRTAEPAGPAVAVKAALEVPAATVTDAGTDAEDALLASITVAPPDGAVADRYTVQVVEAPGAIDAGVQDMLASVATAA